MRYLHNVLFPAPEDAWPWFGRLIPGSGGKLVTILFSTAFTSPGMKSARAELTPVATLSLLPLPAVLAKSFRA
jgi:hypothetical protein